MIAFSLTSEEDWIAFLIKKKSSNMSEIRHVYLRWLVFFCMRLLDNKKKRFYFKCNFKCFQTVFALIFICEKGKRT